MNEIALNASFNGYYELYELYLCMEVKKKETASKLKTKKKKLKKYKNENKSTYSN